ncbi:MAG: hypothetical protein AAFN03_11500 [Pseudomonadota bacterium]
MTKLTRLPLPQSADEWKTMDAPLVRERIHGEQCRIIGKVFSWSPLYFDVAILVDTEIVRRKVSKKNVHLDPCEQCPGYHKG